MEVPALSRSPLWHGWFRADPLPDGSLKRTGYSVQVCRQGICRASLSSAEAGKASVWVLCVP